MSESPTPPPDFHGHWLLADAERARYSEASGILESTPQVAAVPLHADDVAALARWATSTRTALIPRGAGTGMPGGNVGPGVVVDLMTHFRSVSGCQPDTGTVHVQPGATLFEVNAACESHGLHFPVDPSSGQRCTLGGMLANNSAGSHSVRYGATREWTQALEVVLADGTLAQLRRGRPPEHPALRRITEQVDAALEPERAAIEAAWPRVRKNSSGYALREYLRSGDLLDLLVGSEGTLALIVGATLRLAPLPTTTGVALLEFTSLEAAGEAILSLLPLHPATCEMLDRTFLELVREAGADAGYALRPGLEAILLVEVDGEDADEVRAKLRAVEAAIGLQASRVTTATDSAEQHRLWEVRHAASPLIAARADRRVSMQFIEDGVVPVERLPDYVRLLRNVLDRHRLPAVIFGHAGDGNLHVNPLVDVAAPGWRDTLLAVLREVATGIAELGGTLSGEHGDGRLRAPFLETVWGADMVRRFRAVKQAFDPLGVLNPGVILPLPGQHPFQALKRFG